MTYKSIAAMYRVDEREVRHFLTRGGTAPSLGSVGSGGGGDLATQAELDAHAADTTGVHGIADTGALVASADIATIVVLTQVAYDALTPAADTLYVISG